MDEIHTFLRSQAVPDFDSKEKTNQTGRIPVKMLMLYSLFYVISGKVIKPQHK